MAADVALDHLAKGVFVRFLFYEVTPPSYCILQKEATYAAHAYSMGSYGLPL